MRIAVVFVCAITFPLLVHAEERWVCSPASDGTGWQCVANAELAAPDAATPAMTTTATDAGPARTPIAASLDWLPRSELTPEQSRLLPEYCEGDYVEPVYGTPLGTDPATLPIDARAQDVEYWLEDRGEFTGGVAVTRGNQSLLTSRATFFEATRTVAAEGGLTLREPGLRVNGESGELELDTGASTVTDAQFVLQPEKMRGNAARVERNDAGDMRALNGSFTRCDPTNNNWRLTSSEVRVDEGAKFGTARNAWLKVHDFPVLYTPFIRFPVTDERMTGWLFPDFGYSRDDGVDIALPFYLNLAPNYDAMVTPRYVGERGAILQTDIRHLSAHTSTEVVGAFLPHDDDYNGEESRSDFDNSLAPGNFEPADRWLIAAKHQGQFGDFSTFVDYTKVSDLDYFRDLGNDFVAASQVDLQQLEEVQYYRGGLVMRLWAQDFQPLDDDGLQPYKRAPAVDLSYQGELFGPLNWFMTTTWADFDRPNGRLTGINRINGKRLHVEPRLQLPFDTTYGFVHLVGGYRYTQYDLSDVPIGADLEPERKIWLGSVDSGLFFERDTQLFGTEAIQTLEPRLFYLYQQYDNQNTLPEFDATQLAFTFYQLFRDNSFAGIDRIADANQLAAAVTTRLLNAQTGAERLRMSLGQIVYFEDRQVTISGTPTSDDHHWRSPLSALIGASLGANVNLLAGATYDPSDSEWDDVGVALQYLRDNRHIINLGYRRRDTPLPLLRQSDLSFYWSLFRRWSVLGRFNYDLEEHRTIDALAGLEYSDCCWQIRLAGRRFLTQPGDVTTDDPETDEGIYLQVVFKGLAGLGGRIDTLMENGIPGYRAEEF